jgi:hypothetical protein
VGDSTEIMGTNQETGVLPLSPQDVKQWELVQAVREQFRKRATTTSDACKAANVPRRSYYAVLRNPYVQGMMLEQMQALSQATLAILEQGWVQVLRNMMSLAQSADSKEAVQAARLLYEMKKDLEKQSAGQGLPVVSAAAQAVKSFLGGKKLRLAETTVHREIAVDDGDASGESVDETVPPCPVGRASGFAFPGAG